MDVWIAKIISYATSLIFAGLILFLGKWLARFLSDLTEKALSRTKTDVALVKFLKNLVYWF